MRYWQWGWEGPVDGGGSCGFDYRMAVGSGRGCVFILDGGRACGAVRRAGSTYCVGHHALCHIAVGSPEEVVRVQEIELLARAVGGRLARRGRLPPDAYLRRLDALTRVFSWPRCSCIVQGEGR